MERQEWVYSLADADFDIADAFAVAITTPSTDSYRLEVSGLAQTAATLVVYEAATIGVAGTAAVWRSIERSDALEDATHVVSLEYGGTYTGGTTLFTATHLEGEEIEFGLNQSTIYRITFTSLADNNAGSLRLALSKRR